MSPLEEPEQNFQPDHILDWLEDTVSFLPSFLDNPYDANETQSYEWWDDQDFVHTASLNVVSDTTSTVLDPLPLSDESKKRKLPGTPTSRPSKQTPCQISESTDSDPVVEEEVVKVRRTLNTKKVTGKGNGSNTSNGGHKEGRWAELLLNPCALAITSGDLKRVQHLLLVLHELSSPCGDANQRLAAHGFRALTHHLNPNASSDSSSVLPITFASTEPRLFLRSLLKFYEINPWFTFPNTVANSSILQILAKEPDCSRNVHIVDIGVSHGLQWPTLLEALSNRPGGPPPLLRLTIVVPEFMQKSGVTAAVPFSVGPVGDNLPSRLLRFAESINLNLQINVLNNHPLLALNPQSINTSSDETLIFCAQFRLHSLGHTAPDNRTNFLQSLGSFQPKAVILCENDMECSCNHCGNFMTGFSRRVEYLWRFLDSTSAAFKGRECEERRVMEGEAAIGMLNGIHEGKEKWCEKMRGVGFVSEAFGEDAVDGGRALLRKYDSNWEMKIDESNGCVCLWWKGQPVSFCSLWVSEKKGLTDG